MIRICRIPENVGHSCRLVPAASAEYLRKSRGVASRWNAVCSTSAHPSRGDRISSSAARNWIEPSDLSAGDLKQLVAQLEAERQRLLEENTHSSQGALSARITSCRAEIEY